MARRIPHLSRIEFGKVAALGQAWGNKEGKAAIAHAGEIATGGLDGMVVQVEEGMSRP
ncbi:MAG TPA: hypothetical protein VIO37_11395 [Candidatus Dormibacteraeota bacterium]|jgi:hypothetical protein